MFMQLSKFDGLTVALAYPAFNQFVLVRVTVALEPILRIQPGSLERTHISHLLFVYVSYCTSYFI